MAESNPVVFKPIKVESHHDFRGHMKEIVNRLNSTPEIAKLVLVNPIYALRDLNVTLSKEMERHIIQTFSNPPAKQARMTELEAQMKPEFEKLTGKPDIPSTPEQTADFVFRSLGITPLAGDPPDQLERGRLNSYWRRHPLIPLLIEYQRVSRSGLVFFPRAIYDSYKNGTLKQRWMNSIWFGPPPKTSPPAAES